MSKTTHMQTRIEAEKKKQEHKEENVDPKTTM